MNHVDYSAAVKHERKLQHALARAIRLWDVSKGVDSLRRVFDEWAKAACVLVDDARGPGPSVSLDDGGQR